jgi:hypothetical protein
MKRRNLNEIYFHSRQQQQNKKENLIHYPCTTYIFAGTSVPVSCSIQRVDCLDVLSGRGVLTYFNSTHAHEGMLIRMNQI